MEAKSLTRIILLTHLTSFISANTGIFMDTFDNFCANPFFFGKGKQEGLKCTVSYPAQTENQEQARNICERTSPFEVESYESGKITKCTYVKTHKCHYSEISVGDQCFKLSTKYSKFDEIGCESGYKLHSLQSREEQKWIAYLYNGFEKEVWIGNDANRSSFLKPVSPKRNDNSTENKRLKLRMQTTAIAVSRGAVLYENASKILPHLCSKPARLYEKTILKLPASLNEFGFSTVTANDSSGALRPFAVFPLMIPVRGTEFDPIVQELHKSCEVLPNGYAASLNDFLDISVFWSSGKNLHGDVYRTTVGRVNHFKMEASSTCEADSFYNEHRKKWTYYGPINNTSAKVPEEHWESFQPSSYCSDFPRTTAGMLNGYVDIPAMARRPVLCTFGNPPSMPPLNPDDQCNELAHFDKNESRCVCNNPQNDAKIRFPEKYTKYEWGTVCFGCTRSETPRSVVFILDGTYSINHFIWDEEVYFVKLLLKELKNVRVGVVVILENPEVILDMTDYTANKEKVHEILDNTPYYGGYTSVGVSLFRAREMLEKETTTEKIIVIITDAEFDETCDDYCDLQKAHTYEEESKKIHAAGIRVLFVVTSDKYSGDFQKRSVEIVAGNLTNIHMVQEYKELDDTAADVIASKICNPYL